MPKKIHRPHQDLETGEWRYNGKWYGCYPAEEVEKDEAALDDYWERRQNNRRDREGP